MECHNPLCHAPIDTDSFFYQKQDGLLGFGRLGLCQSCYVRLTSEAREYQINVCDPQPLRRYFHRLRAIYNAYTDIYKSYRGIYIVGGALMTHKQIRTFIILDMVFNTAGWYNDMRMYGHVLRRVQEKNAQAQARWKKDGEEHHWDRLLYPLLAEIPLICKEHGYPLEDWGQ